MKDLKEYLAQLKSRLGLKSSGTMESMPIRTFQEFLERLRADSVSLGGDASFTTEIIESPDSSSTTKWGVVMIPQGPRPKGGTPKG